MLERFLSSELGRVHLPNIFVFVEKEKEKENLNDRVIYRFFLCGDVTTLNTLFFYIGNLTRTSAPKVAYFYHNFEAQSCLAVA